MSAAVIDPHTFDELQANAGADFVAELVDTFAEEAPPLIAEMRSALAAGAAERFRRAAHSLKSNSSTFGAHPAGGAGARPRARRPAGRCRRHRCAGAGVRDHARGAARRWPGHERGAPPRGTFGRFAILAAERRLLVDGEPVALGSRAFDLLAALVARRDRVVPKEELIEVVWPGLVVEDNNLQVQISALRKVLGAQAIATVPGRGYQFTVAPPAAAAGAAPRRPRRGAARAAPARAAAPARGSRLLVADDNKVNRLLLCRSLELMGHESPAPTTAGRRSRSCAASDSTCCCSTWRCRRWTASACSSSAPPIRRCARCR